MPSLTSGAQRASSHLRLALTLSGALLASLVVAPVAAAAPATGASLATPAGSQASLATSLGLAAGIRVSPYYSVELYYLRLLNCSRTGGYVRSTGECVGYGSGRYSKYVRPIKYHYGITWNVARPYAKLLATRGKCSHFLDGDPGDRLRRAGYRSWRWGENIGCRDGYSSAQKAVLASHLAFQKEKASNGGHWRNIKNARYSYVGIGVWKYGSRTRLVTDFYGTS